jgi:O-antigen/teichoic acid export membrane protein
LFKNSLYSLFGFFAPAMVMAIAYPVIVHQLGAAAFGIYLLAASISGTLAIFDFGFSSASLKLIAEAIAANDDARVMEVLATSLVAYSLVGGILGGTVVCAAPLILRLFSTHTVDIESALFVFRIAGVQFTLSFITNAFIAYFKGSNRFGLSSFTISSVSVLTFGGVLLVALHWKLTLTLVAIISLIANLSGLIFAAVLCFMACSASGYSWKSARPKRRHVSKMFWFGSAILFSSMASILHGQAQRLWVGNSLGPAAVTAIFVGTWGPAKVNSATLAMSEPLFPRFAAGDFGYVKMRRIYLFYVFALTSLSALILVPVGVFSRSVFHLWFGDGMPPDAPAVASIVVWGLLISVVGQPAYHVINGSGKPWVVAATNALCTLFLFSYLFCERILGYTLAITDFAWATSLSLVVSAIANIFYAEIFVWLPAAQKEKERSKSKNETSVI